MNIDWDKAAIEADDSPRGILASFLQFADRIEDLVVIARYRPKEAEDAAKFFHHREAGDPIVQRALVELVRDIYRREAEHWGDAPMPDEE